jgi:hypothetical protein
LLNARQSISVMPAKTLPGVQYYYKHNEEIVSI